MDKKRSSRKYIENASNKSKAVWKIINMNLIGNRKWYQQDPLANSIYFIQFTCDTDTFESSMTLKHSDTEIHMYGIWATIQTHIVSFITDTFDQQRKTSATLLDLTLEKTRILWSKGQRSKYLRIMFDRKKSNCRDWELENYLHNLLMLKLKTIIISYLYVCRT